jgi:DNA topoisomerase II
MIAFKNEGLEKVFKLRKPISTMNMTLFDSMGKVQRYSTELDIIREFANIRYQYYEVSSQSWGEIQNVLLLSC